MDKILTFVADNDTLIKHFLGNKLSETIFRRIKSSLGNIKRNGETVIATDKIKKGDIVTVFIKENSKPYGIRKDLSLNVLYNDEDVIVVDKPKGVCSMSTNGHRDDCLFAGLEYLFPNEVFRIVTRLDKDTEGLVLVAKNSISHSVLNESKIVKKYTALLCGIIEEDLFIDAPISRGEGIKRLVSSDGKSAKTKLKVIKRVGNDTLCEIELLTGRTHQIRVHTAYISHPVVGDTLYGEYSGDYNSGQKLKCTYLRFEHPITQKIIEIDIGKNCDFFK